MGKLNEKLWAERRAVLGRLAESGLSAEEFCRRESLPYWKLMQWRRRIRPMDAEDSQTGCVGPAFAGLVVRKAKSAPSDSDSRVQMEVALPGGAVIRLFAGADCSLVREVLEAAARC